MNPTKVKTMDDLPELPFEQILCYLGLEDRLKSRAVSRSWREKFNFEVRSLFYSTVPSGYIIEKRRLINGAFVPNFISSSRFESFFNTFGKSVLSGLKHLRLCKLDLDELNETAFTQALSSFGQLEELGLFSFTKLVTKPETDIELKFPMLNSIHLEDLESFRKLTVDAPRLKKVKICNCSRALRLHLIHGDSVERMDTDGLFHGSVEVERLVNLQILCSLRWWREKPTLLAYLQNLKEVYLGDRRDVAKLFKQKKHYKRPDLKIYLCGLLLNRPDDPVITSLFYNDFMKPKTFACLASNQSRLAETIRLLNAFVYAPDLDLDLLERFVDLEHLLVLESISDVPKFLNFLKQFQQIVSVEFKCDQSPDLFNQLSEHCVVQWLVIYSAPADSQFLCSLKHLVSLTLVYSIDLEFVRKVFDELDFLSWFAFECNNKRVTIDHTRLYEFRVLTGRKTRTIFSGLTAAIEFIAQHTKQRNKRKFGEPSE